MDARDWDDRYATTSLMWSQGPNQWVEEVTSALVPGRALDLAAGEGRNAIWLASRGWHVTALDFSAVALERATLLAAERLGADAARFATQREDLSTYSPEPRSYDLVLVVYLQVPASMRTRVLRSAADAVAPGGMLLVTAHDSDNLARGYGGPQDPTLLYSAADVVSDVDGSGLTVERAAQVARTVTTADGDRQALDCLVVATRPIS